MCGAQGDDIIILVKCMTGCVLPFQGIEIIHVKWEAAEEGGRPNLVELEGTQEVLPADLVLLAMGFLGPEATLADALGLDLDPRSNFKVL